MARQYVNGTAVNLVITKKGYAFKVAVVLVSLVTVTSKPHLWQMKDDRGQTWQHKDNAYLIRWVSDRNKNIYKDGTHK